MSAFAELERKANQASLKINCQTLSNEVYPLEVSTDLKILDLKKIVVRHTGLQPCEQLLIFKGTQLSPEQTIVQANLKQGDTFFVVKNIASRSEERKRGDSEISLTVKTPSGDSSSIWARRNLKVKELKAMVADRVNIVPQLQRMIIRGAVLEDDLTLTESGLTDDDVVYVVRREAELQNQQAAPNMLSLLNMGAGMVQGFLSNNDLLGTSTTSNTNIPAASPNLRAPEEKKQEPANKPAIRSVRIKTTNGNEFTLNEGVSADLTVRQLKELAERPTNIKPEHQRVIYRGRILGNNETLTNAQLQDGDCVIILRTAVELKEDRANSSDSSNSVTMEIITSILQVGAQTVTGVLGSGNQISSLMLNPAVITMIRENVANIQSTIRSSPVLMEIVQHVPVLQVLFRQDARAGSRPQNSLAANNSSEPGTGPVEPGSEGSNHSRNAQSAAELFTPVISNLVYSLAQPLSRAASSEQARNTTSTLLTSASTLFSMVSGTLQNQQPTGVPNQPAAQSARQPSAPSSNGAVQQSEDPFAALRAGADTFFSFLNEAAQPARANSSAVPQASNLVAPPQRNDQHAVPRGNAEQNVPRPVRASGARSNGDSYSSLQTGASTLLAFLNSSNAARVMQANSNPSRSDSSRRQGNEPPNEREEAKENMRSMLELD